MKKATIIILILFSAGVGASIFLPDSELKLKIVDYLFEGSLLAVGLLFFIKK